MERQAQAPGIRGAGSALQARHYDIFVDGSTEHMVAIGAAAVASTGNSCMVRRRGFFVLLISCLAYHDVVYPTSVPSLHFKSLFSREMGIKSF